MILAPPDHWADGPEQSVGPDDEGGFVGFPLWSRIRGLDPDDDGAVSVHGDDGQ